MASSRKEPLSPFLTKGSLRDSSICFNRIMDTHPQPVKHYCNDSEIESASSAGKNRGPIPPRACAPDQVKVLTWTGYISEPLGSRIFSMIFSRMRRPERTRIPPPSQVAVYLIQRLGAWYHTERGSSTTDFVHVAISLFLNHHHTPQTRI